jgi:hypothetical protein
MLGVHIAQTLTRSRYMNGLLREMAVLALSPFSGIRTVDENRTAGAFYMVAQRPAQQAPVYG